MTSKGWPINVSIRLKANASSRAHASIHTALNRLCMFTKPQPNTFNFISSVDSDHPAVVNQYRRRLFALRIVGRCYNITAICRRPTYIRQPGRLICSHLGGAGGRPSVCHRCAVLPDPVRRWSDSVRQWSDSVRTVRSGTVGPVRCSLAALSEQAPFTAVLED